MRTFAFELARQCAQTQTHMSRRSCCSSSVRLMSAKECRAGHEIRVTTRRDKSKRRRHMAAFSGARSLNHIRNDLGTLYSVLRCHTKTIVCSFVSVSCVCVHFG